MNKEEAIKFLKEHSNWMSENWSMSAEGQRYKEKFDTAVETLEREASG